MIGSLGRIDRIGGSAPFALDGVAAAPAAVNPASPSRVGRSPLDGASPVGAVATRGESFLDALASAVEQLNGQLVAADAAAADFAAGGATDLHDVVLALSEASIGLRLGVSVRDRLLEAYQEIMRLQI